MREAKFYLEFRKDKKGTLIEKNKKGERVATNVPIRLSYFFSGERLEYYTGIRISNSENWVNEGYKFVQSNEPQAGRINQRLKEMKGEVESLHDKAISLNQIPTKQYLRDKLDGKFKGKNTLPDQILVTDAFQEYLDYVEKELAKSTYKKIKTTEAHFSTYANKSYNKLTFEDITDRLAEGFKDYLIGLGHLNNTVVKYTKALMSFLSWCKDKKRKYYTGDVEINGSENEIDVIYLNKKEVEYLTTKKMPNQSLERVRDVFIFGCYSGMRYQDIYNLKKIDIKKDYLTFYISKGGETVSQTVPLVPQSKKILKKYKNLPGEKALPVISNQKMNNALKKVMQAAEFNEVITVAKKQGNKKIVKVEYNKWELISCHTSRKSFITIAVSMGMPETTIKSITGHSKNSRAFTRYYQISEEVKMEAMKKVFSKRTT